MKKALFLFFVFIETLIYGESPMYNSLYHDEIRLHSTDETGRKGYIIYKKYGIKKNDVTGISVPGVHSLGKSSDYIAYHSEFHNGSTDNGILLHVYKPEENTLKHIFSLEEVFWEDDETYYKRQVTDFDGKSISFILKKIIGKKESVLAKCSYSICDKCFLQIIDAKTEILSHDELLHFASANPDELFSCDISEQKLPDASTVICPMRTGLFEGFGFQIWGESHFYKGVFSHGKYEPEGCLLTPEFLYIGEFQGGLPEGLGTMKFSDGTIRSGKFKKGLYADGSGTESDSEDNQVSEPKSVGIVNLVFVFFSGAFVCCMLFYFFKLLKRRKKHR